MSDMYTKQQNLDISEKCVHETDISIHEPWDTSDMAHRSGGLTVEQEPVAAVELITIGSEQVIAVAWYDSNAFKVGTKLYSRPISKHKEQEMTQPDLFDVGQQSLVDEIKRLTDLNQRLAEVAKELGYADDTHEWDDAWSKMCKLFKEC